MGPELFRVDRQRQRERETDRQTDMTKLIVAFRNFANVPKHGNIQKESTETRLSQMPNISQFNSNSRKIYKLRNKIRVKQSLQNFTNLFEKLQKRKGFGDLTTITVE